MEILKWKFNWMLLNDRRIKWYEQIWGSQCQQKTLPIIAKERSIAYYVQKYFKGYHENFIQKLVPSSSAVGKLYGLVKVYEKDNPFRPVVSTVGSPQCKLAIKFLDKIIEHYIPNKYMFGVNWWLYL